MQDEPAMDGNVHSLMKKQWKFHPWCDLPMDATEETKIPRERMGCVSFEISTFRGYDRCALFGRRIRAGEVAHCRWV